MSDLPIGVLAEGAGGVAFARVLIDALPHEDVRVLSDDAYAPYARRPARVVADRATRMAATLASDGIKALLVASVQGGFDALEAIGAAAGVPTLGLEATLVQAAARARGGRVAAVYAAGTIREQPWMRANRFQPGGVEVVPVPWRGLAEAVDAGREPETRPALPVDAIVALVCPYASVAGGALASTDAVDCAAVAVERIRRHLIRTGTLARRRRSGRIMLLSSHPVRAQRSLRGPHSTARP